MDWFGDSWGAPVCAPLDHTETPVGEKCLACGKPIATTDQGVIVPYVGDHADFCLNEPWHLQCFLDNLGIEGHK